MQSDYRPFDRQPDKSSLVFQIALGVFLGTLAASALIWAGFEFRLRWEADQAAAMLQDHETQAQREIDKFSIECSNQFIRAKRAFDQKYSEGAL